MLNKFCLHVYAQKSLFVFENCNVFFIFYQKHGTHNTCGPTYFSKLRAIFLTLSDLYRLCSHMLDAYLRATFFLSLNFISITQVLYITNIQIFHQKNHVLFWSDTAWPKSRWRNLLPLANKYTRLVSSVIGSLDFDHNQ